MLLLVMVSHHYCGVIGKSIGVGNGNGVISLLWGFDRRYWRKHSVGIGYMVCIGIGLRYCKGIGEPVSGWVPSWPK